MIEPENPDTERFMAVTIDSLRVLVPSVTPEGRRLTRRQAIWQYLKAEKQQKGGSNGNR